MKIISINAGSSSLTLQLFKMDNEEVIVSGLFERIGIEGSCYTLKYKGDKIKVETELPDHAVAVKILIEKLLELPYASFNRHYVSDNLNHDIIKLYY